jgi:hypothetical protein
MRHIVKIAPEWNGSHMSLDDVEYDLPFWAEVPDNLIHIWEQYRPFVLLTTDSSGKIISMARGEEILPEPIPEPEDVESKVAKLEEAFDALTEGLI